LHQARADIGTTEPAAAVSAQHGTHYPVLGAAASQRQAGCRRPYRRILARQVTGMVVAV